MFFKSKKTILVFLLKTYDLFYIKSCLYNEKIYLLNLNSNIIYIFIYIYVYICLLQIIYDNALIYCNVIINTIFLKGTCLS